MKVWRGGCSCEIGLPECACSGAVWSCRRQGKSRNSQIQTPWPMTPRGKEVTQGSRSALRSCIYLNPRIHLLEPWHLSIIPQLASRGRSLLQHVSIASPGTAAAASGRGCRRHTESRRPAAWARSAGRAPRAMGGLPWTALQIPPCSRAAAAAGHMSTLISSCYIN